MHNGGVNVKFELINDGDVTVMVVLEDRLDAAVAGDFRDAVVKAAADGAHQLVLDLAEVSFVDSTGLGAMVSGLKALPSGGSMVLCNVGQTVAALLRLTRMDKVLAVHQTRESALASLMVAS